MIFSKLISSIFILSSLCLNLRSQQIQYDLRSINLSFGDSIVKTTASNIYPKKRLLQNAQYFWYSSGKIQTNYGSYSGKLIHGKYEVFDRNNKLIRQGNFNYGLKQGIWMEWYPDGIKKEIISYKNGDPDGIRLTYTNDGKILSKMMYKEGLLHGKSFFYFNDTSIIKRFKNGKEIVKKEDEDKRGKASDKTEIRKLNKELNDSATIGKKHRFLIVKKDTNQSKRAEKRSKLKNNTEAKDKEMNSNY